MKNSLTLLTLLLCVGSVSAYTRDVDDLLVRVEMKRGERSKDSSSQETTVSVTGNTIVWERTFSGRLNRTPPVRKEFSLSPTDKEAVVKLIESEHLLVTDSLSLRPDPTSYGYFEISVDLTLDGNKGAIRISGPVTAAKVKDEKLYQHTLALVKELYRIMNKQDKSISPEELPSV